MHALQREKSEWLKNIELDEPRQYGKENLRAPRETNREKIAFLEKSSESSTLKDNESNEKKECKLF